MQDQLQQLLMQLQLVEAVQVQVVDVLKVVMAMTQFFQI
jgi:hypothetical protein